MKEAQKYIPPDRRELNFAECDKQPTDKHKSPPTFWPKGFFLKDSRGDKTPLELFVAGVRGWEAAVRRRMTSEMPAKLH